MDYKRYEGETDDELIYRITNDKELLGSWQKVADILNELLGVNYSESKYRKQRQAYDKFNSIQHEDSELEELKEERRKLEIAKVQYRDERNEYRRMLREEARKESYIDLFIHTMQNHVQPVYSYTSAPVRVEDNGNDLIIHLTDVHTGIYTNNYFNYFDSEELAKRLNVYLDHILKIQRTHKSQNAYVILSEVISGLIHENLRCENNENLIEQFLIFTDCCVEFLLILAKHFQAVEVYVCPGNHSRVTEKKESSLKGENFDHLLIPFLEAKLQNISNIHCYYNTIEESVCMFSVRGNTIMGAHGDKDKPKDVVEKFTLMFGTCPDIVYLGHRHKNGLTTVYNTKIVESGSVSGADSYAIDLRLCTKPEQTVSIVDETGLVCLYDIQLGG